MEVQTKFNWKRWVWVFAALVVFGFSFYLQIFGSSYRKVSCDFCKIRFQSELNSNWIIIYPGLVGCGKKCPLALEALRQFRNRFPKTEFSFYFLVTDPKESEEAISEYLTYYQKSLQITALRPSSEAEKRFYRRLGAYLPEHEILKQRDEHGTQFFLIPPKREFVYTLPQLKEKDWVKIQNEILTHP
ncbi:SCO family protein [Leptospira yanagawae]|uniref:SCO family protein n=1 Tax=Leptospira yanagawae TaxID=293069 RepID=UPI003CC82636